MAKKIAIGGDHAGYRYKTQLAEMLKADGHEVVDFGTHSEESADYPDFAHPVAAAVEEGTAELGVLVCGSANGVAMTANKHQGIRAAVCWAEQLAQLARAHNNANIVCVPERFVSFELAQNIVRLFLETDFEGGRHARRVGKVSC